MSVTYLAREIATGQVVTVELLGEPGHVNPQAARGVATLEHPNIVPVASVEQRDGAPVAIVSVYVPGDTLREMLRREGPLPIDRAAQLLREITSAVAHAHERGVVHGAVRPENVVLEMHTGRALLTGFPIDRPWNVETTRATNSIATGVPNYMAPEEIAGLPIDPRTDVYALGLIGWEMLAGRRPWEGETLYQVLHRQQHDRLPALEAMRPEIPIYLLRAIEKAIEKDPARRWRDGTELRDRLAPQGVQPQSVASRDQAPVDTTPAPAPVKGAGFSPIAAEALMVGPMAAEPAVLPPRAAASAAPSAPRRRRWPAVAVVVAIVLAGGLFALTREDPRPLSGDRGLDSALTAANEAGEVVLVDTGRRVPSAAPAGDRCRSSVAADQRACLMAAIERNDAPLNRAYQALVVDVRQRSGEDAVEALRAEQRAWLDERDRACRAAAPESSNRLWGVARAPCFADRSARRAAELRARMGR